MKIALSSDMVGKFVWEIPPQLNRSMQMLSKIGQDKLKMSDEEIRVMEQVMNEQLTEAVRSFLHIICAAYMSGGPKAVVAQELINATLVEMKEVTKKILIGGV